MGKRTYTPRKHKVTPEQQDKRIKALERQVKKLTKQIKVHTGKIDKNTVAIQRLAKRITTINTRLNNFNSTVKANRTELYRQKNEIDDIVVSLNDMLQTMVVEEQIAETNRLLTRAKNRRTRVYNEIEDRKLFGW